MSPLAILAMKVLRWGVLGVAGFLCLVLVLEGWKHGWDLAALNRGFMAVVGLLALGALWLARSIGRELAKHGS
jgi:apolipoprotein N-acyltransferase